MNKKQYWDERAITYDNLAWVKDKASLKSIHDAIIPLREEDVILDIGTGLGTMAALVSPFVCKVVGMDISRLMLDKAKKISNVSYIEWDICKSCFAPNIFDKVIARQVFHHISELNISKVVCSCYTMLKKSGVLTVIEPVCPSEEIRDDYQKIFKLKDGRNVFTENDLVILLEEAEFVNLKVVRFITKRFSVKNWLDNNALSSKIKDKLFEMHVTASDAFRKAYNMSIINGDCLIDIKNIIVMGEK